MKAKYNSSFFEVILIQFSFILVFSFIYYSALEHFTSNIPNYSLDYIDCISLSTTIQAGIGLTSMQPQTHISILLTTAQQIVVIITAVFIVFNFTMGS
jgi:hypothetical protein